MKLNQGIGIQYCTAIIALKYIDKDVDCFEGRIVPSLAIFKATEIDN